MASNYIYIVVGESGSYEDRSQWEVCAYSNKTLAKDHARKAKAFADQKAREIDEVWRNDDLSDEDQLYKVKEINETVSPYDPVIVRFEDDTEYMVVPVKLLNRVPSTKRPLKE